MLIPSRWSCRVRAESESGLRPFSSPIRSFSLRFTVNEEISPPRSFSMPLWKKNFIG